MYEKSNMETYITIYKIDNQWEFAVWLRELKPGLCNNLEGWDGDGWTMLMFGRNKHDSLKQLSFNLKIIKKIKTK